MTATQRDAIYAAVPAIAAVLVTYGIIDENQAATIIAAVLAILAVLVAFVNRPGKAEG